MTPEELAALIQKRKEAWAAYECIHRQCGPFIGTEDCGLARAYYREWSELNDKVLEAQK